MNLLINNYLGLDITPCGWTYFIAQVVFVIECFIITYIAVRWNNAELKIRKKWGVNYLVKDIDFGGKEAF